MEELVFRNVCGGDEVVDDGVDVGVPGGGGAVFPVVGDGFGNVRGDVLAVLADGGDVGRDVVVGLGEEVAGYFCIGHSGVFKEQVDHFVFQGDGGAEGTVVCDVCAFGDEVAHGVGGVFFESGRPGESYAVQGAF